MAKTPSHPLVSVVLAAHCAEAYIGQTIASVLGQTVPELELVVVDDGSTDRTPELLEAVGDPRLRVLRHESSLGLATSLNRGLEAARGRYVARIDADDVALPGRLEAQLARLRADTGLAVLGSAVFELGDAGIGPLHMMPSGGGAVAWCALFTSPFFHPTVMLDRELLERQGLRYDPSYRESEDYELWSRVLAVARGDNLAEPCLLYRRHPGQASTRRRDLQRAFQRDVALGGILAVAPGLGAEGAELAWALGVGEELPRGRLGDAADALVELAERFGAGAGAWERRHVARARVARTLARAALGAGGVGGAHLLARALRLDPRLPARLARDRSRRARIAAAWRPRAEACLRATAGPPASGAVRPVRVTIVAPEPTPFRTVMLDRLARRPELDLTVVYAGRTIARRTWAIVPDHPAVFLGGVRVPGLHGLLRHDYPVDVGVFAALRDTEPDVVVVSGWSTFAAQAAAVWCRTRDVPYVLLVESHDHGRRPGWRRLVKGVVVSVFLRGAAHVLVVGTLARESMLARGVAPERISLFANTVDARAFGERADRLAARRGALRSALGLASDDLAVLSVARLSPEKGLDTLVRAVSRAADPRLVLVIAGQGPQEAELRALADELGVRLVLAADVPWDRIVERFVPVDVFALLSTSETWGVVVNEAAACGLPLVLSESVGAAHDLLVDGENGVLVPPNDVSAAAEAIRRLAGDRSFRLAAGARSRELMQAWGYEPSIDTFVRVVSAAAGGPTGLGRAG